MPALRPLLKGVAGGSDKASLLTVMFVFTIHCSDWCLFRMIDRIFYNASDLKWGTTDDYLTEAKLLSIVQTHLMSCFTHHHERQPVIKAIILPSQSGCVSKVGPCWLEVCHFQHPLRVKVTLLQTDKSNLTTRNVIYSGDEGHGFKLHSWCCTNSKCEP